MKNCTLHEDFLKTNQENYPAPPFFLGMTLFNGDIHKKSTDYMTEWINFYKYMPCRTPPNKKSVHRELLIQKSDGIISFSMLKLYEIFLL